MAERLRRCQNDHCAARSPHPSLRDHRDRQRELALQESRLISSQSALRRCAALRQWLRASPPGGHSWRGPFWMPIRGPNCLPVDICWAINESLLSTATDARLQWRLAMSSRIEDYALIGDCETAALVARDGS